MRCSVSFLRAFGSMVNGTFLSLTQNIEYTNIGDAGWCKTKNANDRTKIRDNYSNYVNLGRFCTNALVVLITWCGQFQDASATVLVPLWDATSVFHVYFCILFFRFKQLLFMHFSALNGRSDISVVVRYISKCAKWTSGYSSHKSVNLFFFFLILLLAYISPLNLFSNFQVNNEIISSSYLFSVHMGVYVCVCVRWATRVSVYYLIDVILLSICFVYECRSEESIFF